jgi:capping protein beta
MAFNAALDLMRRLPPRDVEKNLGNTLALAPDLVEDLLAAVDQVVPASVTSRRARRATGRMHAQARTHIH